MYDYQKHCKVIGRWVLTFTDIPSGMKFLSRSAWELQTTNHASHVVTRPGKRKSDHPRRKDLDRYPQEHGDWTVRHYCGKKDRAIDLAPLRDAHVPSYGQVQYADWDKQVVQILQVAKLSASPVIFGNRMKRRGRDNLIGQKCPRCHEEVPAGFLWIITSKRMK